MSLQFRNPVYIFNIFKGKMTLIADVFPMLRNPKNVVRSMSQKSRFRGPFVKQHRKPVQTRLKHELQDLYDIYWSLWTQLSFKMSLLEICKILRLFLNTLTADDKYYLLNSDNIMQPIQTRLSEKEKTFCQFFSLFLKYNFNFEHFHKKRWPS